MKILLTGGTGLIGRHLIARLQALHHDITVVTRSPEKARQVLGAGIDIWKNLAEQQNLDGFDAVINLAGEPIADKRWTEEQKQLLCSSRWNITEKLVELIRNSHTPPSVLISGSAVGYYGDLGEVVVTEAGAQPAESGETLFENAGVRLWRLPAVDGGIGIASLWCLIRIVSLEQHIAEGDD